MTTSERQAWRRIERQAEWDAALQTLPSPHVLQSWAWGEFKGRWGWSAERWLGPQAAVQILRRRVGPLCVLYAPKGPVAADAAAYQAALAWVQQRAKRQMAVWAKVDGDPVFANGAGLPAAAHLPPLRQQLSAQGWQFSKQQIQFRNTCVTLVQASDDELLARMKPKWRYNVRLAERRGVTVRPSNDADTALLYDMYAETAKRDGFAIREAAYYADAWRSMGGSGFIAEREGQPLAGLMLFGFADRAWYFYGMSRSEGREHMPTYALQWAALRWARDRGYAKYDWWGAPDDLNDPNDGMAGVWRFKEGFDAHFVEGLGAWDYAPSKLLFWLATGPWLKALG
ncbi:MAG: peptidoglycan bridge formation glycyltransferase FemA/FemB family protein [Anaerolineae bacterium]|nr:peptidoglycan bridge formation glycyltransferase FemA/FemB family protein [Anaerolineae bacterium]